MSRIYADTSFWIAYIMPDDKDSYEKASVYVDKCKQNNDLFFISLFILQEILTTIRKKYALVPNRNETDRINCARNLSSRNAFYKENMKKYMESVKNNSFTKYQTLVAEWVNDVSHFIFEKPHAMTIYEVCEEGLELLKNESIGTMQSVFPSKDKITGKPKTCYMCYGEIKSSFLTYKAIGAADITHLLIAIDSKCKRLVTLDKGFRELIPWASPILQIDVLDPHHN